MKDFLLLKKDHFKVDEEGYATVIDKVDMNKAKDKKKGIIRLGNKSTCEVIQLD